jgi:hypothetical protein
MHVVSMQQKERRESDVRGDDALELAEHPGASGLVGDGEERSRDAASEYESCR